MTVPTHIRIEHANGRGFIGYQLSGSADPYPLFMGNCGAQPRKFWRRYCRVNKLKLIEVR